MTAPRSAREVLTPRRAVELMHGQIADVDLPEDDDQELAP